MDEKNSQNRIMPTDLRVVAGRTRRMLGKVQVMFGFVPNLVRVLANAPVALEGYLSLSEALAGGTLDGRIREQIALTVAKSNLCSYCLSAHTHLAEKAGLTQKEIESAISASAGASKIDAILKLARNIVVQRGEISDPELERTRAQGLTDREIIETVANVSLNIFMNYVSHVARTAVDFPPTNRGDSD